MTLFRRTLLISTALLTGCMVGPDYQPPKNDIPNAWHEVKPVSASASDKAAEQPAKPAVADEQTIAELEWWKQFNDPVLNDLIAKGLTQNFDMKIAKARIAEARAQLAQVRSALLPEVDMNASAEREANSFAFGNTTFPKPFNVFQAGFDASWEVDFFGRNRRALEGFTALFGASKANLEDVRVSVLAEIARTYINIRNFQAQVAIASDVVRAEEKNTQIQQELFKAGSTSETEAIRARTALAQANSQLLSYQNQLTASKYALDLLLGEKPGTSDTLVAEVKPIPVADKDIVLTAPADVIANRPDVREAERRLAASSANIGVAKSELFPSISLAGFFGVLSPTASHLMEADSKSWSESATLNWPILNYSRVSSDIHLAKAQNREALETYKKSVLAALVDVESTLSAYNKQEQARAVLDKSVTDNKHGLDLADMRYKTGLTALTEVLDARKVLYLAQSQDASATASSAQDLIAVYKSLGGGWSKKKEQAAPAQSAPADATAPAAESTPDFLAPPSSDLTPKK